MTDRSEPRPVSPEQPAVVPQHEPSGDSAARAEPILLDVSLATAVLDCLGALALFATVAAVSGARGGAVVTSAVGVYVLTGRMLRARRTRLAEQPQRRSAALGQ